MNKLSIVLIFSSLFSLSFPIYATPATDILMKNYRTAGAQTGNISDGKQFWNQKQNETKVNSCTSCHGSDLKKKGQHEKTGKIIEPMSPKINNQRLSDTKKIEKWFKRNCNDVLSRECTPQEKNNVLQFLLTQ